MSRNEHHGLPRSHGGSCHSTNITVVDEARHNDWHNIVGHPTPDGLLRYMLLVHATRLRPSLPPGVIADGLEILDPEDWQQLYEPRALLTPTRTVDGTRNTVRHRIHRWSHLSQELRFTDQVLGALSIGSDPDRRSANVADDLQGFFQTTSPAELMMKILLDRDTKNNEIAWSKPLIPSVRSNLLSVLKGAKTERHTDAQQRDVLDCVYGHLDQVERARARLRPDLNDLRDYQAWRQVVLRRRQQLPEDDCGTKTA